MAEHSGFIKYASNEVDWNIQIIGFSVFRSHEEENIME